MGGGPGSMCAWPAHRGLDAPERYPAPDGDGCGGDTPRPWRGSGGSQMPPAVGRRGSRGGITARPCLPLPFYHGPQGHARTTCGGARHASHPQPRPGGGFPGGRPRGRTGAVEAGEQEPACWSVPTPPRRRRSPGVGTTRVRVAGRTPSRPAQSLDGDVMASLPLAETVRSPANLPSRHRVDCREGERMGAGGSAFENAVPPLLPRARRVARQLLRCR